MKQAKGVVIHMEENKNNFENTEEVMTEQTGAGDAPVTQQPEEQQVVHMQEETMPKQPYTAPDQGQREQTQAPKEDISYSYGEQTRDGMPYQTQGNQYQEEWDTTPLTMGDWLLTLLAAFIPCCGGIILYCYWAFARKGNIHRRNFCRAALIVEAVLIVLLIIFLILVVIIGSVSYGETMSDYYYYGY